MVKKSSKKSTMQDIADELGISKMSVSKSFKNNPDISSEMQTKINDVARRLDYIYKGRNLKTILILINENFLVSDEEFYSHIIKTIKEDARLYRFDILVEGVSKNNFSSCINLAKNSDGIIIMGQLNKEFCHEIFNVNSKIICVDFMISDLNVYSILNNNFIASYFLTTHLISLGHTHIGFVGNYRATHSILDRYLGYEKALIEKGLNVNLCRQSLILDRLNDGQDLKLELPKVMPSAFVCNNDHVAFDLINLLKENGYNVPKDISVTGFDDTKYSNLSKPTITTSRVSRMEMGQTALVLINNVISLDFNNIQKFYLEPKIIYKNSTIEVNQNKKA